MNRTREHLNNPLRYYDSTNFVWADPSVEGEEEFMRGEIVSLLKTALNDSGGEYFKPNRSIKGKFVGIDIVKSPQRVRNVASEILSDKGFLRSPKILRPTPRSHDYKRKK